MLLKSVKNVLNLIKSFAVSFSNAVDSFFWSIFDTKFMNLK
ncbi:hypothetical protein SAMN04488494_0129 [Xylanibacter ruminicola]|uniref:Uncharacterized protein n=1 Tax=Xylanibacter ruminicola TaxID=839 RepID=A0A1M7NR61_XYLRU|nr:hypothetical protein SAMN04488494_0129 [Xylanibacter ruminicola]